MDDHQRTIAEAARSLATAMPMEMVHSLSDIIQTCDPFEWHTVRTRIANGLPTAHARLAAVEFIKSWETDAALLSPDAVVLALVTGGPQREGV